jgi:hypothetical protein
MTLKKSDGIGEENIKQLVSESRGVKLGIETVEKLFADDWIDLEYAEKRIIELQERLKKLCESFNLKP